MSRKIIWLRAETKIHERRTPLTPEHAKKIISCGFTVIVERSSERVFKDTEYLEAGCVLANSGTWVDAPLAAYILGIKELPKSAEPLKHSHIYFAHAYKNQTGSRGLLNRFQQGNGMLYDLEFLQDEKHQRLVSFSYWAGVAGCAVTLLLWIQKCKNNNEPLKIAEFYPSESTLIKALKNGLQQVKKPSSLVIGARGKCARGVIDLLEKLNLDKTLWYRQDTKSTANYQDILSHELLFNCIYLTEKIIPFITKSQINNNQKLSIISDISCDPNGPFNPIPIYRKETTFQKPTTKVDNHHHSIDIMAIDHLPSFLPKESSCDFSEQLIPHLMDLLNGGPESAVWKRAACFYHDKSAVG